MFRKLGLICIVAAFLVIAGAAFISTPLDTAFAGGGGGCSPIATSTSAIRFEVTPGIQQSSGSWPETQVFVKSTSCIELSRGTWFRYVSGDGPFTQPIGPAGETSYLSADPSYLWYANGTYLAYPDGTHNAFASVQWQFAHNAGCDIPKVIISITNPRTPNASASAIIDNRDGKADLYVIQNGKSVHLQQGLARSIDPRHEAEIIVSSDRSEGLDHQCATIRWNLSRKWING